MLQAMGIGAPQARKALRETGGDVERAVDWVFRHPDDQGEFGDAEDSGHYVAFVRKEIPGEEDRGRQWVLFNDEKVVKAADVEEMKRFAYVYFFERA